MLHRETWAEHADSQPPVGGASAPAQSMVLDPTTFAPRFRGRCAWQSLQWQRGSELVSTLIVEERAWYLINDGCDVAARVQNESMVWPCLVGMAIDRITVCVRGVIVVKMEE